MKVKELIKLLKVFPENVDVVIRRVDEQYCFDYEITGPYRPYPGDTVCLSLGDRVLDRSVSDNEQ